MERETRVIQSGKEIAAKHKLVNTPVYRGSSVVFADTSDMACALEAAFVERRKTQVYGRFGSPTTWTLEAAITKLEGGYDTVLCPSGLSAITTALLSFLNAGDHLLMTDSVYGPTRNFCDNVLSRFGIRTTYYDPCIGKGIVSLIEPDTKVVFLENPGSLTLEVQDVPAISSVARKAGVVSLVDNTWGTPLFHRPLELGADVSIQAATKYIVGHSDALVGTVTSNEQCFSALVRTRELLGISLSPDDAYLATRGLRSLAVRLRQHEYNAIEIARWLEQRAEVKQVLYPALPSDPGHKLWQRDFAGASGLLGVIFNSPTKQRVDAFIDRLKYFGLGYSWGGFESLVNRISLDKVRSATEWHDPLPGVRISVGLEEVDDLIADLDQALFVLNDT